MEYLAYDLGILGEDDLVEVTLDYPANVQLLDPVNYASYRDRKPYEYHGGYATTSPYELTSPHRGHWYLVIDLGGGPGVVHASVRVISPAPDSVG